MKKFLLLSIFIAVFPAQSFAESFSHNWFWFFYEKHTEQSSLAESYLAIRPFYLRNEKGPDLFSAILPPVVYWNYEHNDNYNRRYLFGVAGDMNYWHDKKTNDYDFGSMIPPIFYGTSPDKNDRYLFVWPVGGTIKGKLAQDYINAYVFPGVALFYLYPPNGILMFSLYCLASLIPVYSSYGDNGFESKALFWPFFMKGEGNGRKSIRIFPFYAHHTKEGFYDRKMILLLYNYGESYTSKRTYYTRFIFPFYGHKWSSDGMISSHTVLWPFFSWGYNKINGEESLNFPWPIFQKGKCDKPKMEKLILFPFYGRYRYEESETFFLTPLYIRLKKDRPYYYSNSKIICFLIWKFHREYRDKPHEYYGSSWDYFKIWPLFHYEWNDRGDVDFSLLSIFPFRDPTGYERLYYPLFSLFEYHRHGDERSFGLLMRTYYQYQKGDYFAWKIPLIASYSSDKGRITECSFLLSSFGFFRNEKGSGYRIFWIPIVTNKDDTADKNLAISNRPVDYFENAPFSAKPFREEQISIASMRMEF